MPIVQPPPDLRSYLDVLRANGELVEIETEVHWDLEAAEIHRRVIAAGGPALLFRNIKDAAFPLVTNLFGTSSRVDLAFGSRPEEVIERVALLPEELLPPTLGNLWKQRDLLPKLARVGLKHRARGPVTEVIESSPRLSRLPALRTWERDGGPFVTLPLTLTRHPANDSPNLGMYRSQIFDDQTVGVHFQIGKGGGFHLSRAETLNQALPVDIHVGGPPALMLAAIAPLPENVPELLLASLLLGKRLPLCRSREGRPIAADAEFVLSGSIQPGARRPEGPFGDHYGYYSEQHDYPWMQVKTLHRRKDAIWPATVVGKPRQEDFFLGDYLQKLLGPLLPQVMPGVIDLWSYGETGYHSLSAAIVRERYEREAFASAFRILGEGQISLTKFLLLTDGNVDLRDFPATLRHVLERTDPRTDLLILPNLSMDSLDYSGPVRHRGSKGVLVGLGEARRSLPHTIPGELGAGISDARVFTPGALVVQTASHAEDPHAPERIAKLHALADWPLIVISDDAQRAARSSANFLWTTFTRFDPGQDIVPGEVRLIGSHASYSFPLVIDARMKPSYPEELFCDDATAQTVSRRWKEYFPAGGVEMGASDRAHLD